MSRVLCCPSSVFFRRHFYQIQTSRSDLFRSVSEYSSIFVSAIVIIGNIRHRSSHFSIRISHRGSHFFSIKLQFLSIVIDSFNVDMLYNSYHPRFLWSCRSCSKCWSFISGHRIEIVGWRFRDFSEVQSKCLRRPFSEYSKS